MKRLIKLLGCILAGMMLVLAVPAAIPELSAATEVQAAPKVATPQLVSAVPYGKTKITVKWKPVKGVNGYRIYRRTNGSKWQAIRNVSGRYTSYADTKVASGNEYTYTVRAYKKSGGKVYWSKYVIKGVKTIAGLKYLKINTFRKTLYTGTTYDLKILGTNLKPTWSTNNYRIAGVYRNGRVLAKRPGKARFTGILGGRKFTCDVVVKNKPDRMALNYNKVIDYIEKHGKKDSHGNSVLKILDDTGSGLVMQYVPKAKLLDFGSVVFTDGAGAGLDILFNCSKSDKVSIQWMIAVDEGYLDTYASMYASRYVGRGRITFRYADDKKIVEDDLKEIANIQLHETFKEYNEFLQKKLNLSLKDLGFKAYKY